MQRILRSYQLIKVTKQHWEESQEPFSLHSPDDSSVDIILFCFLYFEQFFFLFSVFVLLTSSLSIHSFSCFFVLFFDFVLARHFYCHSLYERKILLRRTIHFVLFICFVFIFGFVFLSTEKHISMLKTKNRITRSTKEQSQPAQRSSWKSHFNQRAKKCFCLHPKIVITHRMVSTQLRVCGKTFRKETMKNVKTLCVSNNENVRQRWTRS